MSSETPRGELRQHTARRRLPRAGGRPENRRDGLRWLNPARDAANTILRPIPSGFLLQARTTSRPRAPVWQRAWSASDLRAMARIGSLTKSEFEEVLRLMRKKIEDR
jgi:hypothetical protein